MSVSQAWFYFLKIAQGKKVWLTLYVSVYQWKWPRFIFFSFLLHWFFNPKIFTILPVLSEYWRFANFLNVLYILGLENISFSFKLMSEYSNLMLSVVNLESYKICFWQIESFLMFWDLRSKGSCNLDSCVYASCIWRT